MPDAGAWTISAQHPGKSPIGFTSFNLDSDRNITITTLKFRCMRGDTRLNPQSTNSHISLTNHSVRIRRLLSLISGPKRFSFHHAGDPDLSERSLATQFVPAAQESPACLCTGSSLSPISDYDAETGCDPTPGGPHPRQARRPGQCIPGVAGRVWQPRYTNGALAFIPGYLAKSVSTERH
jgi:hypothetical protein